MLDIVGRWQPFVAFQGIFYKWFFLDNTYPHERLDWNKKNPAGDIWFRGILKQIKPFDRNVSISQSKQSISKRERFCCDKQNDCIKISGVITRLTMTLMSFWRQSFPRIRCEFLEISHKLCNIFRQYIFRSVFVHKMLYEGKLSSHCYVDNISHLRTAAENMHDALHKLKSLSLSSAHLTFILQLWSAYMCKTCCLVRKIISISRYFCPCYKILYCALPVE